MFKENRLAPVSGFHHKKGPYEFGNRGTTASTAIAVLDACITTSGLLALGAAGSKSTGVALGVKAVGDSATTAIDFVALYSGRTSFLATTKSGSLASTEVGGQFDMDGASGAMGFDADTSTNSDVYIEQVISTGSAGNALVKFADPDHLHATN
jgi:hypothetical protein